MRYGLPKRREGRGARGKFRRQSRESGECSRKNRVQRPQVQPVVLAKAGSEARR